MLFAIRRWIRYDGGFISVVWQGIFNPFRRASSDLPSGDGMYRTVCSIPYLTVNNCRNNHHPSDFKFHWHRLCTISTLSILFLVCTTPSPTIMENPVPRPSQVCTLFESHILSKFVSESYSWWESNIPGTYFPLQIFRHIFLTQLMPLSLLVSGLDIPLAFKGEKLHSRNKFTKSSTTPRHIPHLLTSQRRNRN